MEGEIAENGSATSAGTTGGTRKGTGSGKNRNRDSKRLVGQEEKKQIEVLKKDHYAFHCQICLAEKKPEELAPENSYVGYANHRRKIIKASACIKQRR